MNLQAIYSQASAAHQRGDLAAAEEGYLRLLSVEPNNPQIRHPLGVLRAQQGRTDEALALIGGALAVTPDAPDILLDYGVVLRAAGRADEALAIFDRALVLSPGKPSLLKLRADTLMLLGRPEEALLAFDQLPQTALILHARAHALQALGRPDDAVESFDRALAAQPDLRDVLYERGTVLANQHRIADWFAGFQAFATRDDARAWAKHGGGAEAQAHLAQHEAELRVYQHTNGITPADARPYIEPAPRLAGSAINANNIAAATKAWCENRPQIVVIDNLLTNEALASLRRFCWGSDIWHTPYDGGYIGAFPENGLAAPLLAQIVEEFRTAFDAICGDHALKYVWAFKYGSSLEGIGIHADQAAVNVNFWITPDEANLDPEHGGLVVWDVAAPLDWDFARFNSDEKAIRDFLRENDARAVTIPYRANRAVIFDSDLFHQTDTIRFKDGYQNRRINITLLYGERETGKLG